MPTKVKKKKPTTDDGPAATGSISGIHAPRPAPGPMIPAYGPKQSPLFVLGERPGDTEWQRGRPFIGESGWVLAQWFERAELDLDSARMWNTVNDFKRGNPEPLAWEVERDRVAVMDEIIRCAPQVIAAVGAYAVRWLLGDGYDLDTMHGVPIEWPVNPEIVIVPVYHPANAFYKVELAAMGQADVLTVARVLRGQQKVRRDDHPKPHYATAPTDTLLWLFAERPLLAIDTEGTPSTPWCLTFSAWPGRAYCIQPKDVEQLEAFKAELQQFIAGGGIILLHNSMWDLMVLRKMGIELPPDSFIDTMAIAYLSCLEPQGLKALAYRHAAMEMSSYDELVDEANQHHAIQYILHAFVNRPPGDWPETEPYLIMERVDGKFIPKVKHPWPIARYLHRLVKDFEDKPGTNLRDRWHNIEPDIRKPVEDKYGPMPVATLDDVPLDRAINYAARDADATLRIFPVLKSMIDQNDQNLILAIDLGAIPMFERMQANGFQADKVHFQRLGIKMDAEMGRLRSAITVMTGAEINPNSPDQVGDLLFDQLGLTPGKMTKGGKFGLHKKPSTNDKVLEAMRFTHPVLPHILDYRECSKIKSSFCDPLARLTARDGRIRGTIKVTRVASGRPSMADPNLLAQPVRSDLGKELRRGFIAAPGCILGDWDLSQIEVCEMGHQSEDPVLCELLNNSERDAHSETAALMFGLKLYPGNKQERYTDVDEMRHRYAAKRVGFGVITGITGVGLKDQMAIANATKNGLPIGQGGDPWTEADCDGLILEWFKIYKGVKRYMLACRAEARQFGYVKDRWGRMRYLPGIYSSRSWVREEAERQSHSHKISSSAQGVMKQAQRAIWDYVLDEWRQPGMTHKVGDTVYPGRHVEPIIQIYDSLVFEVQDDPEFKQYWDMVMRLCLTQTTTMRVPIKCKGSYGYRWGGD